MNGVLVRSLVLTTVLFERSGTAAGAPPDLLLFPGLRKCFWTIVGTHLTLLPCVVQSLVQLKLLSHLHLASAVHLIPSCLIPLTPRLEHLALVGATLHGDDFGALVSLGWPMLMTLVLSATSYLPHETGFVVKANSIVTLPCLANLFLDRFPPGVDFIGFFEQLPLLYRLTILDISEPPSVINAGLFSQLTSLRAPIALARAVVPICHIEYLHIVGSHQMNEPHSFHFLYGRGFATLICEYGFRMEHLPYLLFDPLLNVHHTVIIKKLIVNPVGISPLMNSQST